MKWRGRSGECSPASRWIKALDADLVMLARLASALSRAVPLAA